MEDEIKDGASTLSLQERIEMERAAAWAYYLRGGGGDSSYLLDLEQTRVLAETHERVEGEQRQARMREFGREIEESMQHAGLEREGGRELRGPARQGSVER
jgi:hypothetical protein